jgi:tetratricopeptide (TPR) repeat protein
MAEQTGDLAAAADAAVSLGQARMQRGDPKQARAMFERGLALATENRDRYQEVRALSYVALAHLAIGEPPEAALEMAKSATEWARRMPMLVGIVFGLTFQSLALSRLGRHDEAVAASDEVVRILDQARPEGAENILRWRAEVLAAAGRGDDAKAALARARAEIDAKAGKLRDAALRESYLASRARAV